MNYRASSSLFTKDESNYKVFCTCPIHWLCFCYILHHLKGQCHEIFDFWIFSWISFPQAPEYTIRAVSNFFENSRKIFGAPPVSTTPMVHWKMEKIFNHKSLYYVIWTTLGSRVNLSINFSLQVHFKVSAAWYCSHYMPPVSRTLAKLGANCHRCRWYSWCTLTCKYLHKFSKKFEMFLMEYSGDGGKLIHEKNQKQKISWHCPFNIHCLRHFTLR